MVSVLLARMMRSPSLSYFNKDSLDTATKVPDDVMEGHFAVVAKKGEETRRFIVELHYLTDAAFLELLELARGVGFKQKGHLVIPCHPQELEKVLDESRDDSGSMQMYL